jgi:hypothetical protein
MRSAVPGLSRRELIDAESTAFIGAEIGTFASEGANIERFSRDNQYAAHMWFMTQPQRRALNHFPPSAQKWISRLSARWQLPQTEIQFVGSPGYRAMVAVCLIFVFAMIVCAGFDVDRSPMFRVVVAVSGPVIVSPIVVPFVVSLFQRRGSKIS